MTIFFRTSFSGNVTQIASYPPPLLSPKQKKISSIFFTSPAVSVACTAEPGLFVNKPAVLDTQEEGGGAHLSPVRGSDLCCFCLFFLICEVS